MPEQRGTLRSSTGYCEGRELMPGCFAKKQQRTGHNHHGITGGIIGYAAKCLGSAYESKGLAPKGIVTVSCQ